MGDGNRIGGGLSFHGESVWMDRLAERQGSHGGYRSIIFRFFLLRATSGLAQSVRSPNRHVY